MAYDIRLFRDSDAEALSEIALAAIKVVGAHSYDPSQIEAWAARHGGPQMYRDRNAIGHVIFVAADAEDTPVAYALIEPDGHLDWLYNHPDHTRQGLATSLLATAEEYARTRGIDLLYTEASEVARAAFERAGYAVTHRRDFSIDLNGKPVQIHNYAMEKRLT